MNQIRDYHEENDAHAASRMIAETYRTLNLGFASPAEQGKLLAPFCQNGCEELFHQAAITRMLLQHQPLLKRVNMRPLKIFLFLLILAVLFSCTGKVIQSPTIPAPLPVSTASPILATGSTTTTREAVIDSPEKFENGVACDGVAEDGWKVYCNLGLGYTFLYPADAYLETDPNHPFDGVSIIGPESNGDRWPWIEIRHPQRQAEYSPPLDVDLQQWLEDHFLLGASQQVDRRISGTRAVHLRFDRSPQSYAFDRYYFARSGQLYMVLIAHTGDREDWDLYNYFLESFTFEDYP